MDFKLILLDILNSNYRLCFILIFYICDLKFHIIYAVPFIYIIWVFIVFLVILSRPVFFSPRKMDLLHRHFWLSHFPLYFLVSSLPTSVKTSLDFCFHRKSLPKPSYFRNISTGGPAVSRHFQCGGGQFLSEVQDALLPLPYGRDIPVPN